MRFPVMAAAVILALTMPAFAQEGDASLPQPRPAVGQNDILPPPAPGMEPVTMRAQTPIKPNAATSDQKAMLANINAYFNRIRVMSGAFTQVGPDGGRTEGKFYISKPGKLRFQYKAPSPIELIADGQTVAVRDRKLNTQDLYALSQTPLRFLLAEQIDLSRDSSVIGVYGDAENLAVTLEEKSSIGGTARINLVFSAQTYDLKQWTITDAQGYDTTVAIFDIDIASALSDKLFFINQQRILKPSEK